MTDEEWLVIPWAPRYEVSSRGKVRNHYSNVLVRSHPDENEDLIVLLAGKDSSKLVLVKKLVAQMFLPPPPENLVIGHKNGHKWDNRATNLKFMAPPRPPGAKRLQDDPDRAPVIPGQRGRPKIPVKVVETGEVYESITACAAAIGGFIHNISMCLTGRQKNHRGFTFEYAEWDG